MKKRLVTLSTWVLFLACTEGTEAPPANLIDRARFVDLLVDVQLIEAVGKQKMVRQGDPREKIAGYYRETFEKHGVTDSLFYETYDWYYAHPQLMQEVYDEVINELSVIESQLNRGVRDQEGETSER